MRIQLPAMFTKLARMATHMAGRMMPRPVRYWRSAVKRRKRGMLGIWTETYVCAMRQSSGSCPRRRSAFPAKSQATARGMLARPPRTIPR